MNNKEQITTVGERLVIMAPAKINLSLLIAGKRPDGFHEIETIMAKINWYDEISIEKAKETGIELVCKGQYWAPEGRENLVFRAAEMLMEKCGLKEPVKITLTKNIPAGTGLGSASSDAAATLIGLNKYLKTGIDEKSMSKIAATLGSDVAFFLNGPLAFCSGKGEKINKINKIFDFLALLILPDVSISTKKVYENYRHDSTLYGELKRKINEHIIKNRIDLVIKVCANMLESSCFGLNKEFAGIKEEIEKLNIGRCCLSGSGSAFFCIYESGDESKILEYKHIIEEKMGCKCVIVSNNRW
ncbi:MAG: 4-(cytidine 5'-diphospho)-2-C-methyl-D-erythritol kinase [Sedimentisphaerales bacterium]|nr:4-(cytidine 5'-diphospho)-2-C-methyl-D-erythritol kinase [Sedimentisphaerales bacterium]